MNHSGCATIRVAARTMPRSAPSSSIPSARTSHTAMNTAVGRSSRAARDRAKSA